VKVWIRGGEACCELVRAWCEKVWMVWFKGEEEGSDAIPIKNMRGGGLLDRSNPDEMR
jgi:hypothetical protein